MLFGLKTKEVVDTRLHLHTISRVTTRAGIMMDRLHFSIYLLQCVIKTFIQTWTHVFTSTKAFTGHGVLLTGLSKRYIHFLTVYLHSCVIICIFTAPYLTLRLQSRLTPIYRILRGTCIHQLLCYVHLAGTQY